MAIGVRLSRVHARHTDGRTQLQIEASTLRELIRNLEAAYPALEGRFSDGAGGIRSGLSLFVNDTYVPALNKADVKLDDRDRVSLVPYMAGG